MAAERLKHRGVETNLSPYGCYWKDLKSGTIELPPNLQTVRNKGKKAVILVLAGGVALSPIHIGIIGALLENGIPIDAVVGTSAGAVGATAASQAMNLEAWLHAKKLGESVAWKILGQIKPRPKGLVDFGRLAEYIDDNSEKFKELSENVEPIPMVITATEKGRLGKKETTLFWNPIDNKWGKIVQASCSIKKVIIPTIINGKKYQDGSTIPAFEEPVDVARAINPDAIVLSVRLINHHSRKFYPESEPDCRIEPCQTKDSTPLNMFRYNINYVLHGYLRALESMPKIQRLLAEREINSVYRPGFNGVNLRSYFEQKRSLM